MLAALRRVWYREMLLAPRQRPARGPWAVPSVPHLEQQEREAAGRLDLAPYDGLAALWTEFAETNTPNYARYITGLAAARRRPVSAVLDLACGTGVLTERLAKVARQVVGVDASEPMLVRARERCAARPNVRLTHGDFRRLGLPERFDFAVCAGDSLNYVQDLGELAAVFRGVAEHLLPGGAFVFDTSTARGMSARSGLYTLEETAAGQFVIRWQYDPEGRRQTATVFVPTGREVHHRIPLDPADVRTAADGSGLTVDEYFSDPVVPGRWWTDATCYFVLTKRG